MSKRAILRHAARLLADLLRPASGRRAQLYFMVIITLLITVNGFNVLVSYSGRHFMTAIEQRHMDEFLYQAMMMVILFGCSAVVAAFIRFCEERLGLLWRVWLTQKTLAQYLSNRTYQFIELTRTVQHPDQRIAEDIRTLTTSALSFILMMLNSLLAIVAFAGVLWSISPTLFLVSVGYALTGSLMTMWMGHRLIELNSRQVDREADMRSDLLHVGSHTEPIALIGEETHFLERLRLRLDKVARNTRRIISVNRNLTFFSGSYNYLIQIIPALVVAPYFIQGNAEFGVIGQSALAFTILVNAFSLIVSQYPALSSFAAVITRLNALEEANKDAIIHFRHSFEVVPDNSRVAWENVSLQARRDEPPLLQSLTVSIPAGKRVLITATNKNALIRLFNTTAGIEDHSDGKFYRPDLDSLFFLPERPYLAPGSLRDAMVPQGLRAVVDDKQIMTLLDRMGIAFVVDNAGGLQQEHADWNALLSIGEQKMIGIARMLLSAPRFAFLLRLNSVLTDERIQLVMQLLKESKITYINMGKSEYLDCYDAVLEVLADGSWQWQELRLNPDDGAGESAPDAVPPAAPEGLRADPPLPA